MSARVRLPLQLPAVFAGEDDRALLGRFAAERDEAAFASLVRRHGVMVLGVCRRAVGDAHLAEDAFQATFLVLARNPAAAAGSSSVAGWLFGVARRVGLAARRSERRREQRERRASDVSPPSPRPDFDDLLRVLDEELAALPACYRDPLIACFLREQTQDEAARQLGWSLSTLRRRLDRAKELLRARLARRGATLSAGLFAGALARSAAAAVPPVALGHPVPASVERLAAAGLAGSTAAKTAAAVAGVLLLGGVAVLGGVAAPPLDPPTATPTAFVATAAPVPAATRQWVTLRGRVVFPAKREVPRPREILRTDPFVKDADHLFAGGRRAFFEDVLIDPTTRGIRNAVVWLRPVGDHPHQPFPKETVHPRLADTIRNHVVTTDHCQFTPRVTVARDGDTLRFRNTSAIAHNVNYGASGGWPGVTRMFNVLLPAGGEYVPERPLHNLTFPFVDRFECNIHRWMAGYVWTFDHPYAAVTDADGRFAIHDAPVGKWRVVVWHEKGGYPTGMEPRLGRPVTLSDGGTGITDVGELTFDSDYWDEKPEPESADKP
jgi:RNA polymerase sigma factor (sigma-70 family)